MKHIKLSKNTEYYAVLFFSLVCLWSCQDDSTVVTKPKFTITFESNGGTTVNSLTVEQGTVISAPTPSPTKSGGFTFVGWYTDPATLTPYNYSSPVTNSFTLYAKWQGTQATIKQMSLTLDDQVLVGSVGQDTITFFSSAVIFANKSITVKVSNLALADGATSSALQGESLVFGTDNLDTIIITSQDKLTQKSYILHLSVERKNVFSVTFTGLESADFSQNVTLGQKVIKPATPTKQHYDFVSWQRGGQEFDFETRIEDDITLIAKWKKKIYKVGFNTDDGTKMDTLRIEANTPIGSIANPTTKEYFTLAGWKNKAGQTFDITMTNVTSDTVLFAVWQDIDHSYSSDYKYNVDIAYIYPAERTPLAGYRDRLTELLLQCQNYYRKEMNRILGQNLTFGLEIGNQSKLVKIHLIHGKRPESSYVRDSMSGIYNEVDAYFKANNIPYSSTHTIIYIPDYYSYQNLPHPYSLPYNGYGDWAMFTDDPGRKTTTSYWSQQSYNTTYGSSGTIHEMGHAFRLSHVNFSYLDEEVNKTRWTIMNSGYYKFKDQGDSKVLLTTADAYILERTDVFHVEGIPSYLTNPRYVNMGSLQIYSDDTSLHMKAKVLSDLPIKYAIMYQDPDYGSLDYDMIVWQQPFSPTGQIDFTMPYREYGKPIDTIEARGYTHTLRLVLVLENGKLYWINNLASYKFLNRKANININRQQIQDKSLWSVIDVSSQEMSSEKAPASNMIDGSPTTYWHSQYSTPKSSYPHYFTLDMGASNTISGLAMTQRSGGGGIKTFTVQSSTDKATWQTVGTYTMTSTSGFPQFVDFASSVSARYLRITITAGYSSNVSVVTLADLGVY